MLFDYLVIGQVLAYNPAAAVKGPRHSVRTGKTPALIADEMGVLFEAIDTDTLVGLRDRALIGVMIYTFARVSAAKAGQAQSTMDVLVTHIRDEATLSWFMSMLRVITYAMIRCYDSWVDDIALG